jgi:ferredoxin
MKTTPDPVSRTPWRLARRVVLGGLVGAAWAALAKRTRADVPPTLRPPGARGTGSERRSGPEFVGLCIRCGNCVRACPAKIIEPDRSSPGIAGLLAPIIRFAHDYCREDCTRCTAVCPSGALRPLALPEKRRTPIGLPRVDMDVCLLGDDHDCAVCRSFCPFEAIKLVFSEADHTLTPQIDAARCPGCGACQVACPTQPRKAIVVYPLGE